MLNLSVPLSLDSNDIHSILLYEGGTFSSAILSFDVSNNASFILTSVATECM